VPPDLCICGHTRTYHGFSGRLCLAKGCACTEYAPALPELEPADPSGAQTEVPLYCAGCGDPLLAPGHHARCQECLDKAPDAPMVSTCANPACGKQMPVSDENWWSLVNSGVSEPLCSPRCVRAFIDYYDEAHQPDPDPAAPGTLAVVPTEAGPTLMVVDSAHNLVPVEPGSALYLTGYGRVYFERLISPDGEYADVSVHLTRTGSAHGPIGARITAAVTDLSQ
jgi:hypothetical protein